MPFQPLEMKMYFYIESQKVILILIDEQNWKLWDAY